MFFLVDSAIPNLIKAGAVRIGRPPYASHPEPVGVDVTNPKTAFAAAFSWLVAPQPVFPYFAAVAAILTVQVTVADSVDIASASSVLWVGAAEYGAECMVKG